MYTERCEGLHDASDLYYRPSRSSPLVSSSDLGAIGSNSQRCRILHEPPSQGRPSRIDRLPVDMHRDIRYQVRKISRFLMMICDTMRRNDTITHIMHQRHASQMHLTYKSPEGCSVLQSSLRVRILQPKPVATGGPMRVPQISSCIIIPELHEGIGLLLPVPSPRSHCNRGNM